MSAHISAPSRRRHGLVALVVLALLALTACGGSGSADEETGSASSGSKAAPTAEKKTSEAEVTANINAGARNVKVHRVLRLKVDDGTFKRVVVRGKEGPLKGTLSPDKKVWRATGRLQPGETYQVRGVAVDGDGVRKVYQSTFATQDLTLDQQTYPSFFPTDGAEVGVGMPAIIRFDVPVKDKASIERHLKVESEPAQPGAFHWLSDTEVHWRPKEYWKPGTQVTVRANIDSVPAGNGIWGQKNRVSTFTVGRARVSKVDMKTHQMRVFENGKLIRTLPITTGEQPKHTTRSGVKVIVEKYRRKRMSSETVGIDPNSADGYDIDNVEYAMRVTYSGEFIHAAPWSVGSQGRANVSHGCTGLSTENAGWLYNSTLIGDVVEYVGSDRPMTLENGIGDWNLPFGEYAAGSAL